MQIIRQFADATDLEIDVEDKQKNCNENVHLLTQWLNRIIRSNPEWFRNHELLNKMKEKEYLARENAAWKKYINDPERLIDVTYAFINGYISYDSLQSLRIAVCDIFYSVHICFCLYIINNLVVLYV